MIIQVYIYIKNLIIQVYIMKDRKMDSSCGGWINV